MEDLVKIYVTGTLFKAQLIVGLLAEHNIEATILNKRNEELLIGDVEIYVLPQDADAAKNIIASRPK